jgi:hypothetical protein
MSIQELSLANSARETIQNPMLQIHIDFEQTLSKRLTLCTLFCNSSSLLVTTFRIVSSGSRFPRVIMASASLPTSVWFRICCRSKSPVYNVRMSYFCARRAVSVPLPAPGLPNMSIRNSLSSGSESS